MLRLKAPPAAGASTGRQRPIQSPPTVAPQAYTRDEQQSTLHVLWLPIPIW